MICTEQRNRTERQLTMIHDPELIDKIPNEMLRKAFHDHNAAATALDETDKATAPLFHAAVTKKGTPEGPAAYKAWNESCHVRSDAMHAYHRASVALSKALHVVAGKNIAAGNESVRALKAQMAVFSRHLKKRSDASIRGVGWKVHPPNPNDD